MHTERRRARSRRPAEAVGLFLDAARRRLAVRTLTLGTLDGGLLFGSGEDAERVAALGARIDAQSDAEVHAAARAAGVATWRTTVDGAGVVMTSWGGRLSPDLADGVRRILAG